jgi:FkbM family methyltransferase
MNAHLKFRGRVWLTRLGLWRYLQRRRLVWRYRNGKPHEADFRFFRHTQGSDRLFADIGANIGQSSLSFRLFNQTSPIVAFEANPDLERDLAHVRQLLGSSFEYRMHGLGAEERECVLFTPVVGGVALTQEATLFRDALLEDSYRLYLGVCTGRRDLTIRQQTLRLRCFDDLALSPGFVKIDVERAELQILRGMEQTLSRSRPLLLVEGQDEGVSRFLETRQYRPACYILDRDALKPRDMNAGHHNNTFFVPEEMVPALVERGAWRDA